MTVAGNSFFYPNKMGRIILMSLEELSGRNGLAAILTQAGLEHWIDRYPPDNFDRAFRFDEVSQILVALERIYGPRGGRGLALRIGRACFKYGLREFGPILGFTDLAFRLAPLETKLRSGAQIFADIFNNFSDQKVRVDVQPEVIYWYIDHCPVCWQRQSDSPVCHLAVGILQESLYWVSGGKIFRIEETECIAKGDPTCTILIHKQYLE